jgi:hypothetical protein
MDLAYKKLETKFLTKGNEMNKDFIYACILGAIFGLMFAYGF